MRKAWLVVAVLMTLAVVSVSALTLVTGGTECFTRLHLDGGSDGGRLDPGDLWEAVQCATGE